MIEIRVSIKTKLLFFVCTLLIITITALSTFFIYGASRDITGRVFSHLSTLARSKSLHIENFLADDEEVVMLLASRPTLRNVVWESAQGGAAVDIEKQAQQQFLVGVRDSVKAVEKIGLYHKNGVLLLSTDKHDANRDISQTEQFIEGLQGPVIADLYERGGKVYYDIAAPIKAPKTDAIIGVLQVTFQAENLLRILTDYEGLGDTGEIDLGRRDGEDILFLSQLRHVPDATLRFRVPLKDDKAAPMENAIQGKKGIFLNTDYRGEKVLCATDYIPVVDWGVVVKIDAKEAFAPLRKLTVIVLLFSVVTLGIGIFLAIVLAGIFTKPLESLRRGTELLSRGDLDSRVEISRNDEIGDLAVSFNNMAKQLKLVTASRDELNEEIHKRQETEAMLRAALKAKSDFVAMVSHELRTPLTAIKESIAIVTDGLTGAVNSEQLDFLDAAKRNVDRLARLMHNTLEFRKVEVNMMVFCLTENDMNEVLRELEKSMNALVRSKGLELNVSLNDQLPRIMFDRDKIMQVLTNLVNNAIKFTEKGGVTISAVEENDSLKVCVADTGIGVKQDDAERIFHPFEQLSTGAERMTGGTGLGLAICKEIIQGHKGKIWIDPEYGKGARFCFLLPVRTGRV